LFRGVLLHLCYTDLEAALSTGGPGFPRDREQAVVREAYVKGISKSQVSRLTSVLGVRVKSFLTRELSGEWLYVWLDARYLKSRENGHVVTRAVVAAST
jgi:transposase-like protein